MSLKRDKIFFYPQKPNPRSVIYEIINILGLSITKRRKDNFQIAINWEDITFRKEYNFLEKINEEKLVINIKCKNISKKNVDKIFKETFGYSILINPSKNNGLCLVKNDLNAKHDGKIEETPIKEINHNYVYQRIINNTNEKGDFYDIRVPIFQDYIPFVFVKTKANKTRFKDKYISATIHKTEEIFTTYEIKKINEFCLQIGMDYGELDILRDKENKRIYIIDANNTPWGPPSELSEKDSNWVLKEYAKAFETVFVNTSTR